MPNCPLRNGRDIIESYRQFDSTGSPSQISVVRYGWQNPWWAMERDEANVLHPLFPDRTTQRSQDMPVIFCPTGAVWWAKAEVLRTHRTYHVLARTGWEIPWQRGIDIDTEEDFAVAELLLKLDRENQ
jgi:N-acylneuraminate cytidylyltransferase